MPELRRALRRRSVRSVTATRSRRLVVLGSYALAWALVVVGAASRTVWVSTVGLILTGFISLVLAKLAMEANTRPSQFASSPTGAIRPPSDPAATGTTALAVSSAELTAMTRQIDPSTALQPRLDALEARVRRVERQREDAVRRSRDAETSLAAVELAVAESRRLIDKVARHVVNAQRPADIENLGRAKVERPVLSIAIPVYNRSGVFAECLASIEVNLADVPAGSVEVCITDDASSDPDTVQIAADFVRRSGAASLHLNPENLGLEGNLLRSSSFCRGDYVLVLGSDDRLMRGALRTILADLADGRAGVCVYDQSRITLDGRPSPRIEGSAPVDIPAGATREFATLGDGIMRNGLISTIGFTSNVVFRRAEFDAARHEPYFGLTVYPLAFIVAEAHGRAPMRYTNIAVVEHRTPRRHERHAEGIGSSEADFMRGGNVRAARHFGTTLAASYQRLIDSGAIDASTVAKLPECLLTDEPLVEWISENRSFAPDLDATLDADVVADAERFLQTVESIEQAAPAGDLR